MQNKIHGKARRKLKGKIRKLKYIQRTYGFDQGTEDEINRLEGLLAKKASDE